MPPLSYRASLFYNIHLQVESSHLIVHWLDICESCLSFILFYSLKVQYVHIDTNIKRTILHTYMIIGILFRVILVKQIQHLQPCAPPVIDTNYKSSGKTFNHKHDGRDSYFFTLFKPLLLFHTHFTAIFLPRKIPRGSLACLAIAAHPTKHFIIWSHTINRSTFSELQKISRFWIFGPMK